MDAYLNELSLGRNDSPFSCLKITGGSLLLFFEFLFGVAHVILNTVDGEKLRRFCFIEGVGGLQIGALKVFSVDLSDGGLKKIALRDGAVAYVMKVEPIYVTVYVQCTYDWLKNLEGSLIKTKARRKKFFLNLHTKK